MKTLLILPAVIVVACQCRAGEQAYPRAELLMEPSALAQPEAASQFVVLEAGDRESYEKAHVPQARWVDAEVWAKAFDVKDAEGWSNRIGEAGIKAGSKVVVYDNHSAKDAARIWWILRYWGVEDVRLLNGGWAAWHKAGLPVEVGKPQPPAAEKFVPAPRSQRLATKEQLLDAVKHRSLQIVDARSEGEFCGVEKGKNKRGGAIPGAKHLDWTDLIDKETQRFKGPDQIRKLFEQSGIDLEKPSATYCQSGGRASVMAFAVELMGGKQVSNYYASWGEWGNAEDTPIAVTGELKKP